MTLTHEESTALFGLMMAECERQMAERRAEKRRRMAELTPMASEVSKGVKWPRS